MLKNSRRTILWRVMILVTGVLAAMVSVHSQPPTPAPSPALATAPAPAAPPAAATLTPFTARYKVEFFGFTAGTIDASLQGSNGHYQYRTTLNPHGLFRLKIPSGSWISSWIETDGVSVRPLRYQEEDGSSDTDEDVALEFDWAHGVVHGTAHDAAVRLPLLANSQDPLSLQVAVLTDFANHREPRHYPMVDKDKIKEYDYKSAGSARIGTALGTLDTVMFTSTRPGSTKVSRFWYAPSLGYLMVKSEDSDGGSVRLRMTMLSLKR